MMRKNLKTRKLIYVPILHLSADLGEVALEIDKRGPILFGEEGWKRHKGVISGFWESIASYFYTMEVKDFKIYQDGMVADEKIGLKIVEEGVKRGSKNHEIVSKLINLGARLIKTENFPLVKKEYDYLMKITKSDLLIKKIVNTLKYKVHKKKMLEERDQFIARTIDKTLKPGERGILFLGAQHDVVSKLPDDIGIIEVKQREKIIEYQRCFLSKKDRHKLDHLAVYLISPVIK